jgi:hypothetical protein
MPDSRTGLTSLWTPACVRESVRPGTCPVCAYEDLASGFEPSTTIPAISPGLAPFVRKTRNATGRNEFSAIYSWPFRKIDSKVRFCAHCPKSSYSRLFPSHMRLNLCLRAPFLLPRRPLIRNGSRPSIPLLQTKRLARRFQDWLWASTTEAASCLPRAMVRQMSN